MCVKTLLNPELHWVSFLNLSYSLHYLFEWCQNFSTYKSKPGMNLKWLLLKPLEHRAIIGFETLIWLCFKQRFHSSHATYHLETQIYEQQIILSWVSSLPIFYSIIQETYMKTWPLLSLFNSRAIPCCSNCLSFLVPMPVFVPSVNKSKERMKTTK